MKRMNVQIQPGLSQRLNLSEAVARLTRLATEVEITDGDDDGRYVNLDFKVPDLSLLWASVRDEIDSVPGLAGACIVVCEGEQGWDDYLLLHHFDPEEPLDELC